jgi:hypothetical protein
LAPGKIEVQYAPSEKHHVRLSSGVFASLFPDIHPEKQKLEKQKKPVHESQLVTPKQHWKNK